MSSPAQWWLLSDLHLGELDDDPRSPGSVLPQFLRREVLATSGQEQHVAFVGDTFELAGLAEDASLARLESILARHPDTLAALKACAARGVQLHFVCGCCRPQNQRRFGCTHGSCTCPACSWPSTGTITTRCIGYPRCSARQSTAPTS